MKNKDSDTITIDRDVLFTFLAKYRDATSAKLLLQEIEVHLMSADSFNSAKEVLESERKDAKTAGFYKKKCIALMACVHDMYRRQTYFESQAEARHTEIAECHPINPSIDDFFGGLYGVKFGNKFIEDFINIMKDNLKITLSHPDTAEDVISQALGFKDYVEAVKWVFARVGVDFFIKNDSLCVNFSFNDNVFLGKAYALECLCQLRDSVYVDKICGREFIDCIKNMEGEFRKSREYFVEQRVHKMAKARAFTTVFNMPEEWLGVKSEEGDK